MLRKVRNQDPLCGNRYREAEGPDHGSQTGRDLDMSNSHFLPIRNRHGAGEQAKGT